MWTTPVRLGADTVYFGFGVSNRLRWTCRSLSFLKHWPLPPEFKPVPFSLNNGELSFPAVWGSVNTMSLTFTIGLLLSTVCLYVAQMCHFTLCCSGLTHLLGACGCVCVCVWGGGGGLLARWSSVRMRGGPAAASGLREGGMWGIPWETHFDHL